MADRNLINGLTRYKITKNLDHDMLYLCGKVVPKSDHIFYGVFNEKKPMKDNSCRAEQRRGVVNVNIVAGHC